MRAAMSWSWWLLLSPPPPVTQATEPRPTSYGLGSLGKAREARRLPEVAGNSHCSPGGAGGDLERHPARSCSLARPDSPGKPFSTATLAPCCPQPGSKPGCGQGCLPAASLLRGGGGGLEAESTCSPAWPQADLRSDGMHWNLGSPAWQLKGRENSRRLAAFRPVI